MPWTLEDKLVKFGVVSCDVCDNKPVVTTNLGLTVSGNNNYV